MADRSIRDVLVDHGRVGTIVKGMQRREYASIGAMNASSLKAGLIGSNDIDPKLIRDAYNLAGAGKVG